MRYLLIICICFSTIIAYAQEVVKGQLLDSATSEPVQFAHVSNYSSEFRTVTNAGGFFQIPAYFGDTLVFSIVGYQTLGWVVDKSWASGNKQLKLPEDTLLLKDVIVYEIPPEEVFKQRILNYQPKDTSFWYHGMPQPVVKTDPTLLEKNINNPLFAVLQPTEFLYYKFSKREKERRKYHKIVQNQSRMNMAYAKFSRDWVEEVTQLKGDELTDFIQYCDYSIEYLEKTPQYMILEDMLAKLQTFKRDQQG